MRFDASGKPEFREKHVEHAEQVCDACTVGHKGIHIGCAVSELFPCADEESSSEPENHRSGQRPHYIFSVRHVHEKHPDDRHRHRKHYRPDCPGFQLCIPFVMRLLRLVRRIAVLLYKQVVSGILHRLPQ